MKLKEKKWFAFVATIVFFPVGLFFLWKNKKIEQAHKILFTFLIVLIWLIVSAIAVNQNRAKILVEKEIIENNNDTVPPIPQFTQVQLDSIDSVSYIVRITDTINRLKAYNNSILKFKIYTYSKYTIMSSLDSFIIWGTYSFLTNKSNNKEIFNLSKSLRYNLEQLQIAEFPKMRKDYSKELRSRVWIDDIDVKTLGKSNSTLEITGAIFCTNKNKQDFQNTLIDTLNLLRFKQVNYKWYEYDDHYTYYTLDNKKDKDITYRF